MIEERPLDLRLTSARTILEPLTPADLEASLALWTDPDVRRYLWDDKVIDRDTAASVIQSSQENFARHGYGLWAVREPSTRELMGVCGFRPSEGAEPEFLFAFWPRYWGQGLAHETGRAVLDYAFEVLGHPAVIALTDVPNVNSDRALRRLGMQFLRRGLLNGLDTYFYRLERPRHP